MGFLPWEIRAAFPGESQLRQSGAIRPTMHAGCFSISVVLRTLTWSTRSLTCAQISKRKRVTAGEVDKLGKELGNCTHQWTTNDDTNTQALSTLSLLHVKEER